jgi:SSS family transporter
MSTQITLAVVLAYVALLFVVARLTVGRDKRSKHPRWLVTAAMVSASITGITFISLPGSVATDALSYLQMCIGFVVAYVVIAYWLIPLYYRHNVTSLYEYLDNRFGVSSHTTGACFFLISKILSAALRLFVVCLVLQQLLCDALGVPLWITAILFVALAWFYTHRGGLSSVIWGDLIKTICMLSCAVVAMIFVLRILDISFVEALQRGSEQGLTRIFFFDDINHSRHFGKLLLSGIFLVVATTGLDQDLMQRVLSSDSLRSAQRNMVLSSLFQTLLLAMLLLLGVLFYIYLDESGVGEVKADEVFAFVATQDGMPMVLRVLLVLGVVSATFSSIGGSLTALSTSFTVDILHARQRFDDERFTKIYRLVLMGVAVLLVALVLAFDRWGSGSSINIFYAMSSYTFGPLLGMFAFGALTKRKVCDKWVPVVAVVSPLICALLDYNSKCLFSGYQFGFEILLLNAGLTMLGLFLASRR